MDELATDLDDDDDDDGHTCEPDLSMLRNGDKGDLDGDCSQKLGPVHPLRLWGV